MSHDKKDCKLSIVAITHSAVGMEGKVGVIIGARFINIIWSYLPASNSPCRESTEVEPE